MIEVFKTNVQEKKQVNKLLDEIHRTFPMYKANFDLEDCDKILRVYSSGFIQSSFIIELVKNNGFYAEILTDEIPVSNS